MVRNHFSFIVGYFLDGDLHRLDTTPGCLQRGVTSTLRARLLNRADTNRRG